MFNIASCFLSIMPTSSVYLNQCHKHFLSGIVAYISGFVCLSLPSPYYVNSNPIPLETIVIKIRVSAANLNTLLASETHITRKKMVFPSLVFGLGSGWAHGTSLTNLWGIVSAHLSKMKYKSSTSCTDNFCCVQQAHLQSIKHIPT